MSSINKSGTRFIPKLTQRNKKTAVSKPTVAPVSRSITPLPSQILDEEENVTVGEETEKGSDENINNVNTTNKGLLNPNFQLTPPTSQLESNASKLLAASKSSAVIDDSDDEEDPVSNRRESISKTNDNNDTFVQPSRRSSIVSTASSYKRPSISLRRDSIASISSSSKPNFKGTFGTGSNDSSGTTASQRRLSSLSTGLRRPSISKNRQGSINLPPVFNKPQSRSSSISSTVTEENLEQMAPVKIDIPLTNDKKRRRVVQRNSFSSNKKLNTLKRRLSQETSSSIPIIEKDKEEDENQPSSSINIRKEKGTGDQTSEAEKDSDKENDVGSNASENSSRKSSRVNDESLFVMNDDEFDHEKKKPRTRSRRVNQKSSSTSPSPSSSDEDENGNYNDKTAKSKNDNNDNNNENNNNEDDDDDDDDDDHEVFVRFKRLTEAERKAIAERRESEITDEEKKAGFKFFYNPITRKLKKITLDEFRKIDYVDDTVTINNLNSLRGISLTEDASLLNKFEINEETITLEELCRPSIPIGQVSQDFDKVIQATKQRKKQSLERRRLRQEAREKRMPLEELEKEEEIRKKIEREEMRRKLMKKDDDDETNEIKEKSSLILQPNRRRNAPQLTTGSSGGIQINPESTTVDRHSANSNNEFDYRERIEENPYENPINSSSYGKKRYSDKWTIEETKEFFQALSSWGTDFGLISQLFPYRTRKQIKNKFNSEEKNNPHLVELALLRKLPVNLDEYCNRTGKNFKTLDEYNEEIKSLRVKHEREVKEMKANREKARLDDLNNQNNAASYGSKMNNGISKFKNRRMQLSEFRKNEEVVGTIDEVKRSNEGSSTDVV